MNMSSFCRWLVTLSGGIIASLQPALPYVLICTLAVLYDCYTAWSLSHRVARAYPDNVDKDGGKFKSRHSGKVIITLIKVYALIILAFLIESYIVSLPLAQCAAGAVCFWQFWSILENESSCNGSAWAKLAQKILVDKTSRHFDIDLSQLKENTNEKN